MREKKKIFLWLVIGIIFSIAVSSVILTSDGGIRQFYDEGTVQHLEEKWISGVAAQGRYDIKKKICSVENGENTILVDWTKMEEGINYLVLDISHWNGTEARWNIHYRNSQNADIAVDTFTVSEREQIISIPQEKFSSILITLATEGNLEYKLEEMYLTENTDLVEKDMLLLLSSISFEVYVLLSIVWIKFFAKKWRKCVRFWEKVILFLRRQADEILEHIHVAESTEKYAVFLRIALFTGIYVVWKIVHLRYGYIYAVPMNIVLFLALAAWIPVGKRDRSNRVCSSIWKLWLMIAMLQFISELLVKSEFEYGEFIEVWMLICFGLLYRAWERMPEPRQLLDEFAIAVELLFFMNAAYCILGDSRKSMVTSMLTGVRTNPNPLAIGVGCSMVIFLFRLCKAINRRRKWYYYIEPGVGLALGVWMLREADGRNGWIIFFSAMFLFVVFYISRVLQRMTVQKRRIWKKIFAVTAMAGVLCFVIVLNVKIQDGETGVYSLDSFSSGRINIWKEYLGKVGLLGHGELLEIDGVKISAHNGIISMMYRYGILAGTIQLIFIVEVGSVVWRFFRRKAKGEYEFLLAGVFAAYLFASMLDTCDEGMLAWLNWYAFYFIIGYLIQENRQERVESNV